MQIALTNTLTRKKEQFTPADPKRVTLYVCGPTVYNYPHIGNMRPPVVFDVLFRLLRHVYGESAVVYARNYTDIDDKIIAKASAEGVPMSAITEKFARIYEEDTAALGVLLPTLTPRATQSVPAMISIIDKLLKSGAAYKVASGVYFSVAADADYGKLSGRNQDELKAGARVEGEDDKRHPSDFALWKTSKPDEPSWEAPFGPGRPGWHIECSAMIEEELGSPIDIHGGGIDLIFPHHENEIAQSESAHGHALARVWMHNGFLTMDSTKMSKSLGNIITPRELLEQNWEGETIRWALLSAHYRAPLEWSDDLLTRTKNELDGLYGSLREINRALVRNNTQLPTPQRVAVRSMRETVGIVAALSDDLNVAKARSGLAALKNGINAALGLEAAGIDWHSIAVHLAVVGEAADLLGILQMDPDDWFRGKSSLRMTAHATGVVFPNADEVEGLIQRRIAARQAQDWATADHLRREISRLWVNVQDSKEGSSWSVDMSEKAVLRAFVNHAQTAGSVVDQEISVGDFRIDALLSRGDELLLVECKRTLRHPTEILAQLRAILDAALRTALITKVVVVAPHTPGNIASLDAFADASGGVRRDVEILAVNGLGETVRSIEIGRSDS